MIGHVVTGHSTHTHFLGFAHSSHIPYVRCIALLRIVVVFERIATIKLKVLDTGGLLGGFHLVW